MVEVFLVKWPEHGNAHRKLLKHAVHAPPHNPEIPEYSVDADNWTREVAAAEAAQKRAKRGKE